MQEFQKLNITTGQPKVLSILSQKEGYLQKDLAERCHVEPATMTSILKKMEEKELIYKKSESVSGGKRAYAIYLTEQGRALASASSAVSTLTSLTDKLTDDENFIWQNVSGGHAFDVWYLGFYNFAQIAFE